MISVGVRLSAFNLPQIARLTYTDDLHLEEMGGRKVALFCCIPDSDKSLNYLVGMIYGQLIQTLYYVADRKYKGRLPVPVHLLIDEAPNIALPTDNFLPWLSTMRSRNIFCSYIAQNMAQLKALFKEQWESLVGLCDEFLYLGGNEKETHKYVSELMGKETLDTNTYGRSRGRSGSFSVNDQQTGRELLTPDEVRMLDNRKAILFVRGERPMLDDKYDLMRHPNIRLTEDGGAAPYDYTQVRRTPRTTCPSPRRTMKFLKSITRRTAIEQTEKKLCKTERPCPAGKEREIRLLPVCLHPAGGDGDGHRLCGRGSSGGGQQLERLYLFPHPGHRPHSPWLGRGAGGVEFSISRPLPAFPGLSHPGGRFGDHFCQGNSRPHHRRGVNMVAWKGGDLPPTGSLII